MAFLHSYETRTSAMQEVCYTKAQNMHRWAAKPVGAAC